MPRRKQAHPQRRVEGHTHTVRGIRKAIRRHIPDRPPRGTVVDPGRILKENREARIFEDREENEARREMFRRAEAADDSEDRFNARTDSLMLAVQMGDRPWFNRMVTYWEPGSRSPAIDDAWDEFQYALDSTRGQGRRRRRVPPRA